MIYLIPAILSLFFAAAESVAYIGFVHNHLGIYAYYIYLASIVLAIYRTNYPKFIAKSFLVASYLSSAIYLGIIFAETITYPNFVFTATHINPFTFLFFVSLLWLHTLIINKANLAKSLLVAALLYLGLDGMGRTLGLVYLGLNRVASDPFATYEQKMTDVYPGFYPALHEIVQLTPPDATIVIPPQGSPWDKEGNAAMVNYFVYPRTVINGSLNDSLPITQTNKLFVLITKGTPGMFSSSNIYEYNWPKIDIAAEQIWEIDIQNNQVNNYKRDFSSESDKWDWGLIEVKHE